MPTAVENTQYWMNKGCAKVLDTAAQTCGMQAPDWVKSSAGYITTCCLLILPAAAVAASATAPPLVALGATALAVSNAANLLQPILEASYGETGSKYLTSALTAYVALLSGPAYPMLALAATITTITRMGWLIAPSISNGLSQNRSTQYHLYTLIPTAFCLGLAILTPAYPTIALAAKIATIHFGSNAVIQSSLLELSKSNNRPLSELGQQPFSVRLVLNTSLCALAACTPGIGMVGAMAFATTLPFTVQYLVTPAKP